MNHDDINAKAQSLATQYEKMFDVCLVVENSLKTLENENDKIFHQLYKINKNRVKQLIKSNRVIWVVRSRWSEDFVAISFSESYVMNTFQHSDHQIEETTIFTLLERGVSRREIRGYLLENLIDHNVDI